MIAAGAALTGVRSVTEQAVVAPGAVKVVAGAIAARLVARLLTVAITVGPGTRIARVHGARTVAARIGTVTEHTIVARRAVRIVGRAAVGALIARLRAVGIAVGA